MRNSSPHAWLFNRLAVRYAWLASWFGHGIGLPLIVLGYLLSFVAEGLIRAGAWIAGRAVEEPE
jgi:hypothetical protein